MKQLIFYLLLCCMLTNNARAKDHFDLHWINYTQNTHGDDGSSRINVICDIGDSLTLRVYECCMYPVLTGPWTFNGDTLAGTLSTDSIHVVVSQAGTYRVAGNVFFYYDFEICLPPVSPPPPPLNIYCWTSPSGQICPGQECNCAIINPPVYCATSYSWTPPAGATIGSNYGTFIHLIFGPTFTGDSVYVTADNSFGSSPPATFYLYCPGSVGIQNHSSASEEFTISPNPSSDEITITSPQPIHKIEIFNLLGETVFTKQQETNNRFEGVPSGRLKTHLPNGIYIIKTYTENGIFQQKLVINH
ncbi:MAG TPA: T9SS type A sorting domain-containing protein [Bacteroidia bacterium]|nr:T9SS type A sorting domain-containing protein [Bacteroidia bacterium]